jgi:predicted lipoprotein
MLHLIHKQLTPNRKGNKMSVATATYKVGDLYTTQKSKVTGTIVAIEPQANGNVRVKLDVNGSARYTTWTAK